MIKEPLGNKIVFDGGPDDSILSEIGSVLPPWDRVINLIILSHWHSDHLTGLIALAGRYRIEELWYSRPVPVNPESQIFLKAVAEQKTIIKVFPQPDFATPNLPRPLGEVKLSVYHPKEEIVSSNPHQNNLVVKVNWKYHSLLLTGDLYEEQERQILSNCLLPCSIKANIFQVPHHGSKSGLVNDFLNSIDPHLALIPVGVDNRFGHPSPKTLSKLEKKNIKYYRTDYHGRVHLILRI